MSDKELAKMRRQLEKTEKLFTSLPSFAKVQHEYLQRQSKRLVLNPKVPAADETLLRLLLADAERFPDVVETTNAGDSALIGLLMAAAITKEQLSLADDLMSTCLLEPGDIALLSSLEPLKREVEKYRQDRSVAEISREQKRRAKRPRGRSERAKKLEARIIDEWNKCQLQHVPERSRITMILRALQNERVYRKQIERAVKTLRSRTITG